MGLDYRGGYRSAHGNKDLYLFQNVDCAISVCSVQTVIKCPFRNVVFCLTLPSMPLNYRYLTTL